MKKLLCIRFVQSVLMVLLCLSTAMAQFNNEWIDYNKTYYKFKVGADGLYRIPFSTLQANGLGAARAEQFQLWRNGKEVAIFTSVPTGTLAAADYLEFYGQMNDGSLDAALYKKPEFQLADKWSLQTDTSAYFLTLNTASANARMVAGLNNVAGNTLSPEPYFMYTLNNFYKDQINPGYAALVGSYVYSSSYDNGEGWTSRSVQSNSPIVDQRKDLFVAPVNTEATLSVAAYGNALNARRLQVLVNGSLLVDQPMINFSAAVRTVSFSSSVLGKATDTIRILNNTTVGSDRMVVARYQLTYPRQFNFGGTGIFEFTLPATRTGNFLEITNFNNGSVAPVLYDLTSNLRYVGDILVSGKIRFALPAGGARNFLLMSAASSAIRTVPVLQKRQFINYATSSLQGNYLMIAHLSIAQSKNGNALENYRAYRASAAGGGYQSRIFDIEELVDQFAFGVKKHPLSVKNFLRFARKNFSVAPKYVLLIGKAITYDQYRLNEFRAVTERICLVPTFGNPGSDNILASEALDPTPETPVGRLSVVTGDELNDYLDKLKQHDQAISSPSQTIKDKAWMKNMAHIVGGGDPYLQSVIDGYMNSAKSIAEDTSYGAKVYTFNKITPSGLELINSGALSSLFADGLGLITYFGHSSANSMEFNLDDPSIFNNPGRYPLFIANGCNAGNFFIYDTLRFTRSNKTITEDYILFPQRGSIGFISSTHYGIVNYLNLYTNSFYKRFSRVNYPSTIGESQTGALRDIVSIGGVDDFYNLITAEQILLGGDPAATFYSYKLPDYAIEDPQVTISPNPVSVTSPFFEVKAKYYNLGRSTADSIRVSVVHELPDGSSNPLFNKKLLAAKFADSINLSVPVNPQKHKGQNKISIHLDPDGSMNEITKMNNRVLKSFLVTEDEVRPVYPANFAIVNKSPIRLAASTSNFFQSPKFFQLEVDTTELFNSSIKVTQTQTSLGGVVEFSPTLPLKDSLVFYWRVAQKPDTGNVYKWSSSSFVYLPKSTSTGWSQSHYYQYLNSIYTNILLNSQRLFEFDKKENTLSVTSRVLPNGANSVSNNLDLLYTSSCFNAVNSLEFVLIDKKTGKPIVNAYGAGNTQFNSVKPFQCFFPELYQFWYYYNRSDFRKYAMDFVDKVPNGTIMVVNNWSALNYNYNPEFINKWMQDTAIYGPGVSLYHKLKTIGFTQIDSFYRNIPFSFVAEKTGDGRWIVLDQKVGSSTSDIVSVTVKYNSSNVSGSFSSNTIGPALEWRSIHWKGQSLENISYDQVGLSVYGVDKDLREKLLYSTGKKVLDTSLSFINAKIYPYLKIIQFSQDTVNRTPFQNKYLQVKYQNLPEGGVLPLLSSYLKDTLELGEPLEILVTFKNLSESKFDSVRTILSFTDPLNVVNKIIDTLRRPLDSGDTILVKYRIDTKNLAGANYINVNFNPEFSQPEQSLFNNYLNKKIFVQKDHYPPNLDVTFDGLHILNKDIVSSKPNILIRLKDESKYLILDDTSLFSVSVRYPDGILKKINFNSGIMKFSPSSNVLGQNGNEATVLITPYFENDGEYELIVSGRDKSGNNSGYIEYRVLFLVYNKSAISNLLNYPNPFTSSTSFVFTITGSTVPSDYKIQILTITGKIVKEISKQELGPIRIGHNLTEYKWDGTDTFGQPLGNGVYLYRFIVEEKGKGFEKINDPSFNTDRFFKSGYGKMYLMR